MRKSERKRQYPGIQTLQTENPATTTTISILHKKIGVYSKYHRSEDNTDPADVSRNDADVCVGGMGDNGVNWDILV